MKTPSKIEKKSVEQFLRKAQAGVNGLAPGTVLHMPGADQPKEAVSAAIEGYLARYDQANHDHTAWRESVAAREKAEPQAQEFAGDLVIAFMALLGKDWTKLESFGVEKPKDPVVRSAEEKAASARKGQATRKGQPATTAEPAGSASAEPGSAKGSSS